MRIDFLPSGNKPTPGTPANRGQPLAQNLAGFWLFREGAGRLVNDLSGNSNEGVISGGTAWGASLFGSGLKFNAASGNLACGRSGMIDNIENLTISARFVATTTGQNGTGNIANKTAWLLQLNGQLIEFDHFNSTATGTWKTPLNSVPLNKVVHVHVCYNRTTLAAPRIYINNLLQTLTVTSSPSGTPNSDAANNLLIGNNVGATGTFGGVIDFVKLYSRMLTTEEIAQDYLNPFAMFVPMRIAHTANPLVAGAGQPTMRRWGGVPGMTPGQARIGRSW